MNNNTALYLQLFWIAMSELSSSRILDLIFALWNTFSFPDEMYYIPFSSYSTLQKQHNVQNVQKNFQNYKLPAPFIIEKFTANSSLLTDSENIQIVSDKFSISIPEYLNLSTMMIKLNEAIDNLNS